MRKVLLIILAVALSTSGFSEETSSCSKCRTGQAAGYATRDATVLSMMGWGIGLAIGIAVLCALIANHPASTSSSTTQ
jgi:hypothetical protein